MTKTHALLVVTILMIVSGTIIALFRSIDAGFILITLALIPAFIMVGLEDD